MVKRNMINISGEPLNEEELSEIKQRRDEPSTVEIFESGHWNSSTSKEVSRDIDRLLVTIEADRERIKEAEILLDEAATFRLMPAVAGAIWRGKFAAWLRKPMMVGSHPAPARGRTHALDDD
jgi:hypothetical protein